MWLSSRSTFQARPRHSPEALVRHRFGELPRAPINGTARGFPKATSGRQLPGGRIEHNQPGRVTYTSQTRRALTIDATGRHELENRERWAGLSGGPLLIDELIVGVMRSVPEGWKGEAVEAEPLAPLLRRDYSLRSLLGVELPLAESTGHAGPTSSIINALPGPIVPDAPDLPPGYRPRETDIAAVKSLLIGGEGNTGIVGRSRAAGLRGMGGLGKTVLATALVQDADVQNAFSYGIVWLTFGREGRRGDATQCVSTRGHWAARQLHNNT
jgi:hypothetical protein